MLIFLHRSVDWEEFCSYMLLENQHKDSMSHDKQEVPFPYEAREIYRCRNDTLAKIIYFPTLSRHENYDEEIVSNNPGHYITCSKDGSLMFWSLDFHQQKIVNLVDLETVERLQPIWVTDIVCLYKPKKVAIATTDRDISFYEICSKNLRKEVVITGLSYCAVSLDYWQNPKDTGHSYLIFGDAGGNVICLTFMQASSVLFDARLGKIPSQDTNIATVLPFDDLVAGVHRHINVIIFRNLHDDWVRHVQYIPNLDCLMSCSSSSQSLFLGDLHGKKMRSYFKVRKGVYCCNYNKDNNVIVTGGLDRNIRLWNPYVSARATSVLKGHNAAVTHVLTSGNRAISLSKDNTIIIWNIVEQTCVQTLPYRYLCKDMTPITTLFHNTKMNALLLGGSTLNILERHPKSTRFNTSKTNDEIKSHLKPLCGALYNDLFMVVVSCCHGSVVNVWDVHTGEKVIMFKHDVHEGQEITAMSFDSTKRRLITGSRNGTTKIWNFHNGACLRELGPTDDGEITGILCSRQKIFTVGWNHKIIEYRDFKGAEKLPPKIRNDFHKNDIMASDILLNSSYVATASYDGQVTCWNANSSYIYSSINVNKSFKNKRSISLSAPYKNNNKTHYNNLRNLASYSAPSELISKQVTVDNIFFLQNRKPERENAVLLISANRIIQAWSIYGDLLGQFDAIASQHNDESVLSMASNRYNDILLTGDTSGHIRIWDISNYCTGMNNISNKNQQKRRDSVLQVFFSSEDRSSSMMTSSSGSSGSLNSNNNSMTSLDTVNTPPVCLRSYQGHCGSIVSIDFVEDKQLILTASTDCSVRLWTLDGQYIGTFGQSTLWNITHESELRCDNKAPSTLLRVASDQTLDVLNGETPQWKLEKNEFPLLEDGKKIFTLGSEDTDEKYDDTVAELIETDLLDLTNILGKNYKMKHRYKCPPSMKPTIIDDQCVAFSILPFTELAPIDYQRKPSVIANSKDSVRFNESTNGSGNIFMNKRSFSRSHSMHRSKSLSLPFIQARK